LKKGCYLRGCARRLRAEGVSPEDAIVVASGGFRVDLHRQRIGVEVILTIAAKLAATIRVRFTTRRNQCAQMIGQLPEPYRHVALPTVLTTAEVLGETEQ